MIAVSIVSKEDRDEKGNGRDVVIYTSVTTLVWKKL